MAGARSASGTLRAFAIVGLAFFVCWQAVIVLDAPHRTGMTFAIYGFLFHVIFAKGYSLIPAYFDRQLAIAWVPTVHLPLAVSGTLLLAVTPLRPEMIGVAGIGAALWGCGAALFVASIVITVGENLAGGETGTSRANEDRAGIDRYANRFVPIALGYLLVGSYETVAIATPLPTLVVGFWAQISHLLAAGTGGVLVLAIGARLLPRFYVASPPTWAVWVMLPAGAVGPAILAIDFGGGTLFRAGAVLQAVAIGTYAIVIGWLYRRSDRRRVGLYAVALGALAGVAGVAIGLSFAFGGTVPTLEIHHRLTLVGFLGLTIVGVLFQFYPPGIGQTPGVNDRTAMAAILAIAGGLVLETIGTWWSEPLVVLGQWLVLGGGIAALYVVSGLILERRRR